MNKIFALFWSIFSWTCWCTEWLQTIIITFVKTTRLCGNSWKVTQIKVNHFLWINYQCINFQWINFSVNQFSFYKWLCRMTRSCQIYKKNNRGFIWVKYQSFSPSDMNWIPKFIFTKILSRKSWSNRTILISSIL